MADWGVDLGFFQDIHPRIDIRIDISIFKRPMISKFVEQLRLQDLAQMRLIKQLLLTSSRQDHMSD